MIKLDFAQLYKILLAAHALPSVFGKTAALPPLTVQIDVTHRCNLRCSMCFQAKNAAGKTELTADEIRGVINRLPSWSFLTLTGGEPFVRKDFPEILESGMRRGRCNILTNAGLVSDEHIRRMVDGGLTLIGISLDGMQETHDAIRGCKGLYGRVVSVIEKIAALKHEKKTRFPLIDVKTTILKRNMGQLSELHGLAERLGADFFSLSLPKLSDRQFNEPYYDDFEHAIACCRPSEPESIADEEMASLTKQLSAIAGSRGKTKVRFYPFGMQNARAIEKYYRSTLSPADFKPCSLPWSLVGISPYGDVYPCLSYRTGSIKETSLKQIWNGQRQSRFRSQLCRKHLDPFCMGCCYSEYRRT